MANQAPKEVLRRLLVSVESLHPQWYLLGRGSPVQKLSPEELFVEVPLDTLGLGLPRFQGSSDEDVLLPPLDPYGRDQILEECVGLPNHQCIKILVSFALYDGKEFEKIIKCDRNVLVLAKDSKAHKIPE